LITELGFILAELLLSLALVWDRVVTGADAGAVVVFCLLLPQ